MKSEKNSFFLRAGLILLGLIFVVAWLISATFNFKVFDVLIGLLLTLAAWAVFDYLVHRNRAWLKQQALFEIFPTITAGWLYRFLLLGLCISAAVAYIPEDDRYGQIAIRWWLFRRAFLGYILFAGPAYHIGRYLQVEQSEKNGKRQALLAWLDCKQEHRDFFISMVSKIREISSKQSTIEDLLKGWDELERISQVDRRTERVSLREEFRCSENYFPSILNEALQDILTTTREELFAAGDEMRIKFLRANPKGDWGKAVDAEKTRLGIKSDA